MYIWSSTGLSSWAHAVRNVGYMSTIDSVIHGHSVQYHQYAAGLLIFSVTGSRDSCDLSSVINCTSDVFRWFMENSLFLNPTKTEAAVFGTRQRLRQVDSYSGVDVQLKFSARHWTPF